MSAPFLGEVRLFSFTFAPKGWSFCNGQLLPINQNQALFSLLGTFYGGNGIQNFSLPNLQGCVGMHTGIGFVQGQTGGEAIHTLTVQELPQHSHAAQASSPAGIGTPGGNFPGVSANSPFYGPPGSVALNAGSVANSGGGQAHENRAPFLVLNYCIALQGIFPSRS